MKSYLLFALLAFFGAVSGAQAAPLHDPHDFGNVNDRDDKKFDFDFDKKGTSYEWDGHGDGDHDKDDKGKGNGDKDKDHDFDRDGHGKYCDPAGGPSPTPLPGSVLLFGTALVGLTAFASRKQF